MVLWCMFVQHMGPALRHRPQIKTSPSSLFHALRARLNDAWNPPSSWAHPLFNSHSTLFSLSLLHNSRDNNVKGVIAECQNHPEICIISNGQTNCRTRPHLRDQIINRAGSEGGDAAASIEVQYIRCGVSSQRCVINDVKTGRGGLVVLHSGRYYLGLFF